MTIKELRTKARETLKGRWLQIVSIFILVQLANIAHGIFHEEWKTRIKLYAETSDIIISLAVSMGLIVLLVVAAYSIVANTIKFTRGEKVGISTFISDMAANIGRSIKISLAYLWHVWKWFVLATIAFSISPVIYDSYIASEASMMGNIIVSITMIVLLIAFIWALADSVKRVFDYYMTYYLAFDYPEKPLKEIFEKSKELMKGYKAKIALLPFTFMGWFLLSIVPMYIAIGATAIINSEAIDSIPSWGFYLLELFTLVTSIVTAYMAVALAHFYENFNPNECFNEDYIKPEEQNTKNYKIILAIIYGLSILFVAAVVALSVISTIMLIG